MNGSEPDFEQFLKRRRVPAVPAQWRGKILSAARAARKTDEKDTPEKPWWLAWLWPSPVAWAGIGCAWLLALGMNAMSGLSEGGGAPGLSAPQSDAVYTRIIEERRLVREFFGAPERPAAQPPPAPVPSGASYERRRQTQTMAA